MTNAEKYKDAIIAQTCKTGDWAVNKSGEITPCEYARCADCEFNVNQMKCIDVLKEWLNADDEKKVFYERDREVLRALDKVQWVAREEDGTIYGYHDKPCKGGGVWLGGGDYVNLTKFTTAEFASVKMEDDEPTSREEILGDEE